MTEEMQEKVKSIFLKVFDKITPEEFDFAKKADQYENWDSFTHMEIISEAEIVFSTTLEMEEISLIDSADKLIEILQNKK